MDFVLPSWYGDARSGLVGWSAQPTLHEHAAENNLKFIGTEATHIVWVMNGAFQEVAACCYFKKDFCNFMIPESDKRGNIARALARHVHAFSSCGCVPLPIGSRITGMCVRCKVEYDTTERIKVEALRLNRQLQEDALMDRGEALNRQEDDLRLRQRELDEAKREASDLQLREEALRLDLMHQGEALNRKGDELRLQQKMLDEAKRAHDQTQSQLVMNNAATMQLMATRGRRSGTRQLPNPVQLVSRSRPAQQQQTKRPCLQTCMVPGSGSMVARPLAVSDIFGAHAQLKVVYAGGNKVVGTGGQTTGIVAGFVEFDSSGMTVPVVVKQYDLFDAGSVLAIKQEFAALTSMKQSRRVVRCLGMCAESRGLVLERLPLDLRDLFEASHKNNHEDYQVHYLLERPISTAANAKKYIVKVCLLYISILLLIGHTTYYRKLKLYMLAMGVGGF